MAERTASGRADSVSVFVEAQEIREDLYCDTHQKNFFNMI
jgi:hypothetical protein